MKFWRRRKTDAQIQTEAIASIREGLAFFGIDTNDLSDQDIIDGTMTFARIQVRAMLTTEEASMQLANGFRSAPDAWAQAVWDGYTDETS